MGEDEDQLDWEEERREEQLTNRIPVDGEDPAIFFSALGGARGDVGH
jgi:hypothetical protein